MTDGWHEILPMGRAPIPFSGIVPGQGDWVHVGEGAPELVTSVVWSVEDGHTKATVHVRPEYEEGET
jgi:hypothetical protein